MSRSPELQMKDVAFNFQKHGHNRASAVAYAELAKSLKSDPAVWTGLGAALAREEAQLWAAKSLLRGLSIAEGTPFASPCRNWLNIIAEQTDLTDVGPLADEEIDPLLAEIDSDPEAFLKGVAAFEEDDQIKAVEGMVASRNVRFLPVILNGVRGAYGKFARREALRDIKNFGDTPEIRAALAELAVDPDAKKFQPFLGKALNAIDPEWAAQFGEI